MTVKDMYTGFMKPEEKAWWKDRLTKARTGFYTPPAVGVDTINLPSVNGGALFFSTGADPTNGTVYVRIERHAVDRQAGAGRRIHGRQCGRIDSVAPAQGWQRAGRPGFPTQEEMGRAVYEQTCQVCHGPELKGDRGPALDTVVSRLGADATRNTITNGRGAMPAFSSLPAQSMNDLMAFLHQARPGAPGFGALRLRCKPWSGRYA